ncbi:putative pentatricopeptide repeat-containing protein [Vitis vinifera]|uniref:Putative pentatricopeptide repeat-containing protein n=1 Tax=Vitis vinifera TaxID=29760 RepID=A0A438JSK0_VITVI|nr:putative pentatricopeptide repeat-containing protein [Vitis vinifera]
MKSGVGKEKEKAMPSHHLLPMTLSAGTLPSPSLITSQLSEASTRPHLSQLSSSLHDNLYSRTGLLQGVWVKEGVAFHGSAVRCGVGEECVSWTAMIAGYASFSDLVEARKLFDEMPEKNAVSWNAIISGYVKCGDLRSARKMFDEMPHRNVVSFTTMIDGYAKSGDMASARFVFEEAPERDVVAWSALISGYVQNGQPNEAVKIFLEMCSRNVKPDEFIMVSLMSACSQMGSLELAKWVDDYVRKSSIDVHRAHVIAALIDMNAKCGSMDRATKMLNEGLTPDDVAFTVILTACSRAGLVDEGCYYFESMKTDYSIVPSPDHYACMVDLLGRAGRLKEAYELLKSMPVEPHAGAWGALLGACKLHCDIELGEVVADQLFELEPQNAGNYVLLSNIYAAAEQWLDDILLADIHPISEILEGILFPEIQLVYEILEILIALDGILEHSVTMLNDSPVTCTYQGSPADALQNLEIWKSGAEVRF